MKIPYSILIIVLILQSCGVNKGISKKNAKIIAENYLIEQGWTDKKINTNTTKIDTEGLELKEPLNEHLKLRYNTLIPKAVYAERKEQYWIIGFRYNENQSGIKSNNSSEGRAVMVSNDGTECHMIWKMFDLNQ